MRKHRAGQITEFSGLHHDVAQAENRKRTEAGPSQYVGHRSKLVLREGLCSSASPAASSSSNANATVFACCANQTTRCVFVRMGITTARIVGTPVTFVRRSDGPARRRRIFAAGRWRGDRPLLDLPLIRFARERVACSNSVSLGKMIRVSKRARVGSGPKPAGSYSIAQWFAWLVFSLTLRRARSCSDFQQLKISFATSEESGRSRTEGDALD